MAFPQRYPFTAEVEHHGDQARAFAKTRHPRTKCLWFSGRKLGTVLFLTKRRFEKLIQHQPAFIGIPVLYNRVWPFPGSFGSSTVHPCGTHTHTTKKDGTSACLLATAVAPSRCPELDFHHCEGSAFKSRILLLLRMEPKASCMLVRVLSLCHTLPLFIFDTN